MKNLTCLILSLWLPMAHAFEVSSPKAEWIVMQSHRAMNMNDFVVGLTMPASLEKEVLAALEKRGIRYAPVPEMTVTKAGLDILGPAGEPMIIIDTARGDEGIFTMNGQIYSFGQRASVESIMKRLEDAFKGRRKTAWMDLLLPRAEGAILAYLVGIGVAVAVVVTWGPTLLKKSGGAVDKIIADVESGNNGAAITDFKCDSEGRIIAWQVSTKSGSDWIPAARADFKFESGSEPKGSVRYVSANADCDVSWFKKDMKIYSVDVNEENRDSKPISQYCKGALPKTEVGKLPLFASFASLDKVNNCCKDADCRKKLTDYIQIAPEDRGKTARQRALDGVK